MSRAGLAVSLAVVCATGAMAWASWHGAAHVAVQHGAQPALHARLAPTPPRYAAQRASASVVRSDLFGAPPAASKPATVVHAVTTVCAPPPDPLAGYTYMGVVEFGDKRYALVEDAKSKEGMYLEVGNSLAGFTVTGFDQSSISLRAHGQPRTLAMNTAFDLLPLDRDAPFLGGRETPHNSSKSPDQVAFASFTGELTNAIVSRISLNGGQDVEQMKNDVFDGKMSQQEFDQKVGSTQSATVFFTDALVTNGTISYQVQSAGSNGVVMIAAPGSDAASQRTFNVRLATPSRVQL